MPLTNQTLIRHILQVTNADELSEGLAPLELARLAADWVSSAHAWNFLRRPLLLDLRASISLTGATWTSATKLLTKVGAFADYTYVAGDVFEPTGGTGARLKTVPVATRVSDDAITLDEDIQATNGATDIAGRLPNNTIALPTDFLAFPGVRPLWSENSLIGGLHFTSHEALTQRRSSNVEVESSWYFYAAITEMMNQGTEATETVLDLYPPSSVEVLDAFRGHYRARIVIDTEDEDAVVPVPTNKPAIELLLIKACRAFALGFEEGEEADQPGLDVLLEQLQRSTIWHAARKQDGGQQPTVGPMRGGVGGSRRAGRSLLSSEVDGPT